MAVPWLPINHQNQRRKSPIQESQFANYDELPLFLNAKLVAQTLGIGLASAYELMHDKSFPTMRIGSRFVVPKEKFRQWVEQQMVARAALAAPMLTAVMPEEPAKWPTTTMSTRL